MTNSFPLVSVVIPTFQRPQLLLRAIQSVRRQSLSALEIIVVVDGPDQETSKVLSGTDDYRLKIISLPQKMGRGAATNAGVHAASCDWIALLDDDDEWLPEKLAIQWRIAQASLHRFPIVSCRLIARAEAGDQIWPRRYPRPGEPLSEYLLVQHGLRGGEGILLPSTLLVRRDLLLAMPWGQIPVFNDLDWLLRAVHRAGVAVEFVPNREPLAIWYMERNRKRISTEEDWKPALRFGHDRLPLLTRRAHVAFILTQLSRIAARSRDWRAFFFLIGEAFRIGWPRPIDLAAHLLIWLVGWNFRVRVGATLDRWREKSKGWFPQHSNVGGKGTEDEPVLANHSAPRQDKP
jgi:glycosyltransferase involved in cell wall biosynthesis